MEEKLTCRICFENDKKCKLLRPCYCREPIHRECLKMWIEIKKNPDFCEICKKKYIVDFTIIPVQQTAIIVDENNISFILNNKKFTIFLKLISLFRKTLMLYFMFKQIIIIFTMICLFYKNHYDNIF